MGTPDLFYDKTPDYRRDEHGIWRDRYGVLIPSDIMALRLDMALAEGKKLKVRVPAAKSLTEQV